MANYQDTRWPWRVTITKTDGTAHVGNYGGEFDSIEFARNRSEDPDIARVDVSTSFVAGQQVTPAQTEA